MTELILIRHGETDWNRELRFQGQVDVPLNATGLEQARRVAQRLLAERFGVEHLVCSDLLRTRQTAEPAAQALLPHLSLDAVADPGLREQNFGVVDGLQGAKRSNSRSYCEHLQRRRPLESADAHGAVIRAEAP